MPSRSTSPREGKDQVVTDQKNVEKEIFNFYQNLYKSQESNLKTVTIQEFLGENDQDSKHPTLSRVQADKLEGPLSVEEATKYIKKCRTDASPGSSGFTGGF